MQTTDASSPDETSELPLYRWFPELRRIPRAQLCDLPSPVHRIHGIEGADDFWIKRDDLNAGLCGGNKARALEFLLGDVKPDETVLTLGGAGSTHVLSTALHARRLGARVQAVRWLHDMSPVAERVSLRILGELGEPPSARHPLLAILRCHYRRLRTGDRYIPVGGSVPLGILGSVNAGLELADQINRRELPQPARLVLPLGSGGTAAGIALGLEIAGLDTTVIGARVGPRLFVNRRNVLGLARKTARLIRQLTGRAVPEVSAGRLAIDQSVYGGAYGRPLAAAADTGAILRSVTGIELDSTYSEKAFLSALRHARAGPGPTLFWLTFDIRCLTS